MKVGGSPWRSAEFGLWKPMERCGTDSRSELFCPEVCNPRCIRCDDNPEYLHLDKPRRSCEWVAKKPSDRCFLPPDGEIVCECQEACNPICKSKCQDNKHYCQRGHPKRSCDWVAKNPKKRCPLFKHEAWFGCPKTCNRECK